MTVMDKSYPQLRLALRLSEKITRGEWVSGTLDTDKHNLKKHAVFKAKEYIGQALLAPIPEGGGQVAFVPTEHCDHSPNSKFIAVSANAIRDELAELLPERDRLILTCEHDG